MILDFNLTTEQTGGGTEKTKLSEFTNDVGFVTNAASDLLNYYLKSETYTQAEINQLVAGKITFEVVDELPEASALTMNKIYLVPSAETKTRNVRDEYITIDKGVGVSPRYDWELIGSTRVDLSNYYNKTETDTLLGAKQPTLVSGTNIKTINNTSLLGSGNISIETPNPMCVTYIEKSGDTYTSSKTFNELWAAYVAADKIILAVDCTSPLAPLSLTNYGVAILNWIDYGIKCAGFTFTFNGGGQYQRTIFVAEEDGSQVVMIQDGHYSEVEYSSIQQSGTKLGTITIDGTNSYIYAPDSSKVTFSQTLSSGSEIGQLTIDGTTSYLYAPAGGASTDEIEEVISRAIYDTRDTRPTTSYVNGMITNALSGIIYDGVDAAYTNRALSAKQGTILQQQINSLNSLINNDIYDSMSYTISYTLNYIGAYLGINI